MTIQQAMLKVKESLSLIQRLFILCMISSLISCATYQSRVRHSRELIENGHADQAAFELEKTAFLEGNDQLVYLLDYAVALQMSGQIEKSNRAFIQADKLAEKLDYISVSGMTGSLLLNEEMKHYRGDSFEKIFINAYLAMNFLNLNKMDEALVEARRMNEKYRLYRQDEKKSFEMNVLGKYLSALSWEASGRYDDAYIAYSEAYSIDSTIPYIGEDLIRSSKLARRNDVYKKWKSTFSSIEENLEWYQKEYGELIFIFQQGWGPRKDFLQTDYRFPVLRAHRSRTQRAEIELDGYATYQTRMVYDVEAAAIRTLEDDVASLMGKKIAAEIAKQAVANKVAERNELLGHLTYLAMKISDRADLRQWSTLPQSIQMVRLYLPAGKYSLKIRGLDSAGQPTGENFELDRIEIKPQQKTFKTWRSVK